MDLKLKTRINLLIQKNGSYTAIMDDTLKSKQELTVMKELADDLGYSMVKVSKKVRQVRDLTACTCGSRNISYSHYGIQKLNVCDDCGNTWFSSFSPSKKHHLKGVRKRRF